MSVFDKIIEIDGKKMSSETSEREMNKAFQHIYHKVGFDLAIVNFGL